MQVRISDDGKKYEHAMEDIFDEINEVEASDFFCGKEKEEEHVSKLFAVLLLLLLQL